MTLLGSYISDAAPSDDLVTTAKSFIAEKLIPPRLTREVIRLYISKALRSGYWRFLSREAKALLLVTARVVTVVKSPVLKDVLKRVLVEIELSTLRGKAVFYGFIVAVKNLLAGVLNSVGRLLLLGISYLNNPPIYRVYG